MQFSKLTIAIAALGMVAGVVPVSSAIAQERGGQHGGGGGGQHAGGGEHGGGEHQGGGDRGGGGHQGDGRQGGGYNRGGNYGHGYGYGGAGFALGAILGYYGGHPYYCRHHRHWRWSNRLQTYVYYNNGGYC